MHWDRLRIFFHVAQAGSFTHAGRQLNLSQSAISRQIAALEKELGVELFHRHARGLIVTQQGDMLYATASEMFGKVAMVERKLADSKKRPAGHLSVTTTTGFAMVWLMPRIAEFMDRYPEISISLLIDDAELDLSMGEADVGIRFFRPTQPGLIQRRLKTIYFNFYASPDYLKTWGTPTSVEDLEKHRVIMYGHGPMRNLVNPAWLPRSFGIDRPRHHPALTINSVLGMHNAVESGLGIAVLPDYVLRRTDRQVRVDINAPLPVFTAHIVYPEEQRGTARIAAFRDFLVEKVSQELP